MARTEEHADERGGVIAFRAGAELIADADIIAASEGISRADVARRALLHAVKASEHKRAVA